MVQVLAAHKTAALCSSQARGRQEPVHQEPSHTDWGGGAAVRPQSADLGDSLDAFSVKTAFLPVDHSQIPDRIPSPAPASRSHAEVQTQQVSAQLHAVHLSCSCLATSHGRHSSAWLWPTISLMGMLSLGNSRALM